MLGRPRFREPLRIGEKAGVCSGLAETPRCLEIFDMTWAVIYEASAISYFVSINLK